MTQDTDRSLLQGVDSPNGSNESGPDRDTGGVHGRDKGEQESGPDKDTGGVHGRDKGEHEAGPDRDVGGAHGRDSDGSGDTGD